MHCCLVGIQEHHRHALCGIVAAVQETENGCAQATSDPKQYFIFGVHIPFSGALPPAPAEAEAAALADALDPSPPALASAAASALAVP
jgi:hypothetical protein